MLGKGRSRRILKIRKARHFGSIVKSGISASDVARILRCFRNTDLPIILSRYPIKKLGFVPDPEAGGLVRSGYYQKSAIHIYVNIKDRLTGEQLAPGQTEFLSDAGTNRLQTLAITLAHEIGHHLHMQGGQPVQKLIDDAFTNVGRGTPITDYADSLPEEYFAESFAAYLFFGQLLQAADPVGYNMVKSVIETLMR